MHADKHSKSCFIGVHRRPKRLFRSDDNLDDDHLMRTAGRFSRRLRAWNHDAAGAINL
jgi:hypothetical protein